MKHCEKSKNKATPYIGFAIALLVASAFFKFALAGYGFLALVFLAFSVWFFIYGLVGARLRRLLLLALSLWFLIFLPSLFTVLSGMPGQDFERADYLIVPGAKVNGTRPSKTLEMRLAAALDYLGSEPDCIAVVSGGQGEDEGISEAECMAQWLVSRGIAEERIVKEDEATSTAENLLLSAAKIGPDYREKHIVICSNEYHLARAKRIAEEVLGMEVGTFPARTNLPVLRLNNCLREACGLIYMSF